MTKRERARQLFAGFTASEQSRLRALFATLPRLKRTPKRSEEQPRITATLDAIDVQHARWLVANHPSLEETLKRAGKTWRR